MTGRHILIVSPTPSHPQDQGNRRRIYEVCRALKDRGFTVHFVWYAHEWGGVIAPRFLDEMKAAWDYFHIVPIDPARQNYARTSSGHGLDDLWYDGIGNMIGWAKLNFEFEAVIVNYVLYSKACSLFAGDSTVTVIDTHDVLGDRYGLLSDEAREKQFYSLSPEDEATGLARADIVLAIQEQEEAYFRDRYHLPHVLTLGHRQPESFVRAKAGGVPTLGLIGSFNAVNLENYQRLAAAIADRRATFPADFRLMVAGAMSEHLPAPVPDFVHPLGKIPELEAFYEAIDLAVIPLEFGTGLKIKAVEALAHGVPVVSTAHGFIGLEAPTPHHGHTTLESLVEALPGLLTDTAARTALRAQSRAAFAAYHTHVEAQIDGLISAIATRRREKETQAPVYVPGTEIPEAALYVYGAGLGGRMILGAMPETQRHSLKGFIDRYKAGETVEGLPVVAWQDIPEETRGRAAIILALANAEWPTVARELQDAGFARVLPAHGYIIKRMTESGQAI